MKTLFIVRHAKSSWDHPGLGDDQRPILPKGKKRTKYVVDYFLKNNLKPDLIISSHAVRAFETAKIIATSIDYPGDKIIVTEEIYHGDVDTSLSLIFEQDNNINSLMMVGHNPTFTYLANTFLDESIFNLPTSGVVCIEFQTDKWEEIMNVEKRTKFVISPKMLKNGTEK